jgi:hypothetical protein
MDQNLQFYLDKDSLLMPRQKLWFGCLDVGAKEHAPTIVIRVVDGLWKITTSRNCSWKVTTIHEDDKDCDFKGYKTSSNQFQI